jgi:hypothetical protein
MKLNRYTVETDLPFDVVSDAIADKHPRQLIMCDSSSTISRVSAFGNKAGDGPMEWILTGIALVVGILIGLMF